MDDLFKEIYIDEHIIVVYKNHCVYSIPDRAGNAVPLIDILRENYGNTLVTHRLDFGTSGVMVFARNKAAHKHLSLQFEKNTVKKRYAAITDGFFFNQSLMLPIAAGSHGKYKINFKSGKKAVTSFYCLDTNKNGSLYIAEPVTGKTHQIRVHLKALKAPLYYDFLYNKQNIYDKKLSLQCLTMQFQHPATNKFVTFSYNLSDFMKKTIKSLELSDKNVYQYLYENN